MSEGQILAVDDDLRNLEIITEILEDDYNLTTAESGEQALEMIADDMPNIILLDIMMSGIDGYEVTRQLKEKYQDFCPKIILVSGKALVEEKLKGYEVGADDYITKPFDCDELFAKVKVFHQLATAERKLVEMNQNLEEEVKERTAQLLRSENMAFLGMHTAEYVHNLKNPLTVLQASSKRLGKEFPENKYIDKIQRASEKLNMIITDILNVDKSDAMANCSDVNACIKTELEFLKSKPIFNESTTINLELADVANAKASQSHLAQILSNIIGNALDAIHDQDTKVIGIKTENLGNKVKVIIKDSGVGIPEEDLSKIFTPFFTTKPLDAIEGDPVGTGLGLPSCLKMIESYGGTIDVQSIEEAGTIFTIVLPAASLSD